ncbi:RPA-interacting protein isoform X2 [Syngnathoides biaculeatus]|uniref:RPA-interacting protein isoform X2 n=1 Tax=Syngnathoides biaculeatus TaxID=300417 RepID=UPI002ADD5044|nr:RPA-interacting protein isoform X2 [Syngnathoides biaculeatus]
MDALHRHRSLYKGTTPPWKEEYRKRCVERLKGSRSRLLDRYRKMGEGPKSGDPTTSLLVQEVMEAEWTALKSVGWRLPSLWGPEGVVEMWNVMKDNDELALLEEIQQELLSCEMSIIEEYERDQQEEQQYLSSIVEGMDEVHVICPICHMSCLNFNSHFISCPCGLHINTTNITPDVVQNLLESRVLEHMEGCNYNPVFSLVSNSDFSPNLIISCKVCDYLSIVL